jgi:hypothetical protein
MVWTTVRSAGVYRQDSGSIPSSRQEYSWYSLVLAAGLPRRPVAADMKSSISLHRRVRRCVANGATAQHATDIVVLPTLHSVPTDLRCSECLEYSRSGAAHAVAAQQPHCSGTARKLRCAASTVGVRRASPLFEEVVDARRERHDQLGCSTVRRTCGVHYRCSSEVFGAHGVMVCNTDTHCGAHFIAERCKYNCRTRARVSGSQCHSGPAVGHKATAI